MVLPGAAVQPRALPALARGLAGCSSCTLNEKMRNEMLNLHLYIHIVHFSFRLRFQPALMFVRRPAPILRLCYSFGPRTLLRAGAPSNLR